MYFRPKGEPYMWRRDCDHKNLTFCDDGFKIKMGGSNKIKLNHPKTVFVIHNYEGIAIQNCILIKALLKVLKIVSLLLDLPILKALQFTLKRF